jgi:lactoylglutathione lyase
MATRQKPKRVVRRSVRKTAAKRPVRRGASKTRTNGDRRSAAATQRRQPETLRLRSVTPTLTVNDLQKSITWYCDGLGFIVSERWDDDGKLQGVMLKAGNCTFMLSQDDFEKGRDRQKGEGFRIYADTVQNIDALADRIRAFGGRIIREPADMPWGTRSFAVEDPDGFKITFSQEK